MKKKLITVIIVVLCIGGIYLFRTNKNEMIDDLSFKNIEALAEGESGGGYRCYGVGSIDCHSHKVEEMYTGLRLDLD